MPKKALPKKWEKSEKSIRAVQIAFELSTKVSNVLKDEAGFSGLSTSDQIRKIIGLTIKPPKRPRLTITLSHDDYQQLSAKYQLNIDDKSGIRQAIRDDLVNYCQSKIDRYENKS
ncbi:MAG: hypothetical protein HON94_06165 [Methylococcales bacterium]|jgi:hypothetical protein|nr:hypothetical protein [Methylococcales bacterium]MBT7410249.1 hypothetical protein [Methylococcales bacterium]